MCACVLYVTSCCYFSSRSGSPLSDSGSDGGYPRSPAHHGEGGEGGEGTSRKMDELFEPFSPVNSPDHMFDLSDEDTAKRGVCVCVYVRMCLPVVVCVCL